MTRSFAYLGVKAANLFIGEIVLGLFLLTRTREILGRWLGAMTAEVPLSHFAWVYYLFAGYGIIQVLRGMTAGYPLLTALQTLVFNVYPLYIFLGLWVGIRYPNYLGKFFRWLAWCNGIYGLLYIVVLNPLFMTPSAMDDVTGEQVAIFGQPAGSGLAILGLLCFERKLRRVLFPLLLNAFVMLALQVRGEWLGFGLGFVLWGVISRRVGSLVASAGAIALLLAVGYVADFSIPAPVGRGGQISSRDIVGRGLAAIDPEGASKYSEIADSAAGTVEWRRRWWRAIWDSVHETSSETLLGHGYGYPLTDLVSYMSDHTNVRSPHSIFFFCLGYGGWIGVSLFFAFQLSILRLHWLTYRQTKNPFGIAYLVMCVSSGFFGNFFETPFGAIPYYLITGLAVAPLFASRINATETNSE